MTCEVVVSNKNGMSLAADSAVTLGPQRKVFHSAEKLFRLSEPEPVAIMTYGNAEMMGIPWGTIIKIYQRKLGSRRFDLLGQYTEDFLRFLESANPLFSETDQKRCFKEGLHQYFGSLLRPVWKAHGADSKEWEGDAWEATERSLVEDQDNWAHYDVMPHTGPGFGKTVLQSYRKEIDEFKGWFFDGVAIPGMSSRAMDFIIEKMYETEFLPSWARSGIVIAGFGDQDVFPRLDHVEISTITGGRLRHIRRDGVVISHETDGVVTPLAQRHMIDAFYDGIHPMAREILEEELLGVLLEEFRFGEEGDDSRAAADKVVQKLLGRFQGHLEKKYLDPLVSALAALPISELASLAEALVNLSVFKAKMSTDETSTIGGEIDVAVISKSEGFVWVKRKALMGRLSGGPGRY